MSVEITKEELWYGYRRIEFLFDGRVAMLAFPKEEPTVKKWLFKTEYAEAFPQFELDMLERGYYVANLANHSRWTKPEDITVKPQFCEFLHAEFGLEKKCVPVGMSCGGMHGIYFAAAYPEYVAALYIDAPVVNLLSCPFGLGVAENSMADEFIEHIGLTKSEMLGYRNHPLDHIDELIDADIPLFMVAGDSDRVVPYCENGELVVKRYRERGGRLEVIVKPGCDHHPHGLEDNAPLIAFVQKYY